MQTTLVAEQPGKAEFACNSMLEAALEYARRGWRVFPLYTPTSGGCSCRNSKCESIGKHPRIVHGLKAASANIETVRGWWGQWPDANIAIATGPESGVFVLDVDGGDGQASLKLLEAQEQLPRTLCVLTGRQGQNGERTGFHLYYNCPAGTSLANSAGRLGKGLDIRAAGGYAVAPPSLHVSGVRYVWTPETSAISHPPAWLIAKASKPVSDAVPMLRARLLCEGERNDLLFRLASAWRRRGATQEQLERQLSDENVRRCRPPLERKEVQEIAASVAHRYSPGGPDPLDSAWEDVKAEAHCYSYEKFRAIVHHLGRQRPGCPILLPVERVGKLIGCDPRLVGRHRKRAIAEGLIQEVEKYIAHEKATRFKVIGLSFEGLTTR